MECVEGSSGRDWAPISPLLESSFLNRFVSFSLSLSGFCRLPKLPKLLPIRCSMDLGLLCISPSSSDSFFSGCLRFIPPLGFPAFLSIVCSPPTFPASPAVTPPSLSVLVLAELITGTSSLDINPITGVMNDVSVCVLSEGHVTAILVPVGSFEAVLPEGGREREARIGSPMLGGRDATKNKEN